MKRCHCLVRHPQTPQERAQVVEALRRARELGDTRGTMLAVWALSGRCPARDGKGATDGG
jgi:hypothetical protein